MSRDFLLWFFSWVSFLPAPEYSNRTISNFFKNLRRYSHVKVHHRYEYTGGKFTTVVNYASGKLPPFINDTGGKFATGLNNTRGRQWEQLSNGWQLKMNLKKKVYLYANSTTQRCPKERRKIFLIEDFFHLPPVSTTPVVHLSPRIFEKIRNSPNGIIRGLEETDPCRKPEVENLVALSL